MKRKTINGYTRILNHTAWVTGNANYTPFKSKWITIQRKTKRSSIFKKGNIHHQKDGEA